ncbi:MAG: kynureninase [Polyangiales bacterium]
MSELASRLAPHYTRFLRPGRILLTGHSHQAWPDVALDGVVRAFEDAATHVDDKWEHAAAAAGAVQSYVAKELGGHPGAVALAVNTHELVTRFLSALDYQRRHIVTTAGEFHSIRRQLQRLEEEGVEVTRVPVTPLETLGTRLAEAVRPDTAALMTSTVLFESSSQVPGLVAATTSAFDHGAQVLLDAYHHFGVVPWRAIDERAFVVGGGYKYAQWGEGACFMRVPAETTLRPVYTGWFSDFAGLAGTQGERVAYGNTPADRFAGSTYDPTSHYRARAVIEFFEEQGLTIDVLAQSYQRQTARIIEGLGGFDVVTPSARGGFVSVRLANAADVVAALRDRGVFVDSRAESLRFGPAPYVHDEEIDAALAAFREVARR